MPDRSSYKSIKTIHEVLVHGYDLDDETFDIVGYNKIGHYGSSKLNFSDFRKAYMENAQD